MIKRQIKEYKSPHGYPGQLGQPKLVLDVGGGTSRMKTAGRRHASSIQSPRPLEGAGTGTQAAQGGTEPRTWQAWRIGGHRFVNQ